MDTSSLQSIEEQLPEHHLEPAYSKSEYLKNLKSQCLYRQNAIKTAEILIDEYLHENEQLKLEVVRLNKKIENYEETIQSLKHQIDSQDLSNLKNCQKELFKSSFKLSQVLEKYSILQQKYHSLEKQFLKFQNKHHEKQKDQIKDQQKKKNQMKIEIQKQFNNFLKTPTNKNTSRTSNQYVSTQKKSYSKQQNKKILLHENDQSSEDEIKVNNIQAPKKKQKQISQSIYDTNEDRRQKFSYHSNQFKKIPQNKTIIMSSIENDQSRKTQVCNYKDQQKLINKLKILEWKIKQKDQEILLMLRRNKQIEGKYEILKEIMNRQKDSHFNISQNKLETIDVRMHNRNEGSSRKKRYSQITKKSNQKLQSEIYEQNSTKSPIIQNKNQSRINTSYNNSSDNTTWKNFHTYKLH